MASKNLGDLQKISILIKFFVPACDKNVCVRIVGSDLEWKEKKTKFKLILAHPVRDDGLDFV